MSKVIPALPVHDIQEAVAFYEKRLGFRCAFKKEGFAKLLRDEAEIHLWVSDDRRWKWRRFLPFLKPVCSGAESFLAGTHSCRILVNGIDELYAEYKESKTLYDSATLVEATPWGTREFPALDLHRNLLTFYEPQ